MTFRMELEIEGLPGLQRALRDMTDRSRRELQEALDESGEAVRDSAVREILHGEKTGRIYTHYLEERGGKLVRTGKRSTPHQASAPGEAPASDTGNLVSNIVVDNSQLPAFEVAVASLAPYSAELEYGRGGNFPMEPRPFMKPALLANEEGILARVRTALGRIARWR